MSLAERFYLFFATSSIKFNNTRARMLDSIYNMTLRLPGNLISAVKALYFCHYISNLAMDVITFQKSVNL